MLLENLISSVIFTLYIGQSSGKRDQHDLSDERWSELIIALLIYRHYKLHLLFILYSLSRKNLLEFFLMYPGYLLEFKNNVSWKLVRLDL